MDRALRRGWISPDVKKQQLLYISSISLSDQGTLDIFSAPKYSKIGQITDGIDYPVGLATDKNGNLYVANSGANTITVYAPGTTSPSRILKQSYSPVDVAVGSDGTVYVGDGHGGIDVYAPGETSANRRLRNPVLKGAINVGVDTASNSVYATSHYHGAVVRFTDGTGSGENLHVKGLQSPDGVIVADKYLIVSDSRGCTSLTCGEVLLYPRGQRSPSSTFMAQSAERSVLNKAESRIYVPGAYNAVGVYAYPNGTHLATVSTGAGFSLGAALGLPQTR